MGSEGLRYRPGYQAGKEVHVVHPGSLVNGVCMREESVCVLHAHSKLQGGSAGV